MLWLVILLPLLGAILNGLVLRKVSPVVSHIVGSAALVSSFVCAVIVYWQYWQAGGTPIIWHGFDWIEAGDFSAPFRLVLDRLSGLMLLVVTGIGSLIHIYAGGYMHEEKATWRFFSYLNLFVFMMLLLVLGDNLLVMFVGWEGVGLCSYLLIGYWYESDDNAAAGMKAFLVNRIGDIGFLIGIFMTYKFFGTVSFSELRELVLGTTALTAAQLVAIGWITLALFIGACGKSAQFPLYVWLPDAMAGPTPVSALIHAATMVTAGIYMMTRLSFFYYLAPTTQMIVATVGAFTALFAATIAIVQTDIKKVLAYSTVSQLGYMVLGCGVGAFGAGVFHLFTHACFKALLFLGAGSVIVAMHHRQDMREMGGLKKFMPITHKVMLIGVLAIIGFPGLSGFFSKDEILWKAWIGGGPFIWALAQIAAFCTAFYMVRLLMLTFYGPYRGNDKKAAHGHGHDAHGHGHGHHDPHETSAVMWAPLVVLAILSIFVGYLNVPHAIPFPRHFMFDEYLGPNIVMPEAAKGFWPHLYTQYSHAMEYALMGISVLGAFIAAGLAIKLYGKGPSLTAMGLRVKFKRTYDLLLNKYWVDEIYDAYIVKPLKDMSLFLWKIVDVVIIDGIVNGVGQACLLIGGLASFRMTGSLHRHGMMLMFGVICLIAVLVF
jgi:NADH-quinone oxidoreductase subunit L